MIDRWSHKRNYRHGFSTSNDRTSPYDGSNNGVRLRRTTANRSKRFKIASTVSLLYIFIISIETSSNIYTANAFSAFRPGSIASVFPWSSESPTPSHTALFMFSFRNDNNMEDKTLNDDSNGTTNTIKRIRESDSDDEAENFSAWMEGLKLGTPLGKMASSMPSITFDKDDSETDEKLEDKISTDSNETTTTIEAISASNSNDEAETEAEDFSAWMEGLKLGTPLGKMASSMSAITSDKDGSETVQKSELDSNANQAKTKNINRESLGDINIKADVPMKISMEDTGRRKINPLSNLIQFEAMLELAKSNKDEKNDSGDSSSATDMFAVVDRLVKTFQQQADQQEKEQSELLQLAQLEKKIIAEEKLVNKDSKGKENSNVSANVKDISATTTVKDLIDIGGISFPKVNNIWDTFSGDVESVDTSDDGSDEGDTESKGTEGKRIPLSQASTGTASSSPLFRVTEGPKTEADTTSSSTNIAQAAESILKETTSKMEYLVTEASNVILEPSAIAKNIASGSNASALQDLVGRASNVFNNTAISPKTVAATTTGTIVESISNDIVAAAQKLAKESGVDINVQFAADRAREATEFAVGVAGTANMVLDAGYAYGSRSGAAGMWGRDDDLNYLAASAATQTAESVFSPDGTAQDASTHQPPLFGDFASAQRIEPHEYDNVVFQGAEMGKLAGAIYEDSLIRCHKMGHTFVANGTTANVAWMVTDSVMDRERYTSAFRHHDDQVKETENEPEDGSSGPVMIRTITIRGFDASDESVDREALLNEICFGTAEPMDDTTANLVVFHKGLLNVARQIYADTKKYIDWTSPNHKIILNGHSIGGSLSILMLLLIASERGADYVHDRILRVYSHGSPPVATLANTTLAKDFSNDRYEGTQKCPILEAFDLPPSLVYGFIQPYDPVVRLFSSHDVLYPLVDDLGKDGITLYSSGPIRSLRPITRAIFQAWEGWPQFRDNWKGTCDMQYQSVGIQHMLLPEPLRYLNDRFISVNVGVPPVDAIVRISPEELLPALDVTFPLDTFQVSLVPQAVRSFLHHFYPAYDSSISDYATKMRKAEKVMPGK